MTPFCEVSISSHNGGLYDDRSMSETTVKGYQNGDASASQSMIPSSLITEFRCRSQELINREPCGGLDLRC